MDNKFEFGIQFQIDILTMLTKSIGFMVTCQKFVKTNFFSTDRVQYFAGNIYKYYNQYETLPDKTFIKSLVRDKKDSIFANAILNDRFIQDKFIKDQLKEFVKRSTFIE